MDFSKGQREAHTQTKAIDLISLDLISRGHGRLHAECDMSWGQVGIKHLGIQCRELKETSPHTYTQRSSSHKHTNSV